VPLSKPGFKKEVPPWVVFLITLKAENMQSTIEQNAHPLVFWPELLGDKNAIPPVPALVPVSKSTWLNGIAEGRYPAPVRLSQRKVAWRRSDINALLAGL
jgi:predicted DNA-binding transcriptional regulator AlpA